MAKDFDEPLPRTERMIRLLAEDEIVKWHKHMQESEDAAVQCAGGHKEGEIDETSYAIFTILFRGIKRCPLSFLWILGSILLGIETGYLFSWLGGGLLSLVIGWLILRMVRAG